MNNNKQQFDIKTQLIDYSHPFHRGLSVPPKLKQCNNCNCKSSNLNTLSNINKKKVLERRLNDLLQEKKRVAQQLNNVQTSINNLQAQLDNEFSLQ